MINAGNLESALSIIATEQNQEDLKNLISTLQELVQRLAPLGGVISLVGGQSLKVSGTVAVSSAPSTAVTGPITSALSIAEKAIGGVGFTMRVAEENMAAIQSNINNIIAN